MIGDQVRRQANRSIYPIFLLCLQWRRLTATERDKFEEKARERAKEQEVNRQQTKRR